jgi:two-component system response regulator AtoC
LRTNISKILICELHRGAGSNLDRAISSLDYSTYSVDDGDQARKCLVSSEVDISIVMLNVAAVSPLVVDLVRDIRVTDPKIPLIIVAESCSAGDVVTAVRNGATDFLCAPLDGDELSRVLASACEACAASKAKPRSRDSNTPGAFSSNNPLLRQIELRAATIGWSGVPVLIQGETGSGKEMLAKTLHANSHRSSKPFLKLNCAALPADLVESELFGYERGAFTGAFERKTGIFEAADGGTILLDEIGDMDIRLQAKLLQVLQDQEFRRIGGREVVKVDVRVIAATHRDLKAAISNNTFREDLYYRLNVVVLHVPPLRERVEDIIPLTEFLIRKHSIPNMQTPLVDGDLKHAILIHDWPGNVRELENCVRNLVIFRDSQALMRDLRSRIASRTPVTRAVTEPRVVTMERHEATPIFEQVTKVNKQAETNAILAALNATHWNRKRAAAMLKVDYKSLLYKMRRLNIDEKPLSVAAQSETSLPRAVGRSD